ncbi:MAG: sulfotransferase [Paracoccaceae bacterium]
MSDRKLFDNLFLSIGAMKAGTTWLFAVLSRHPELHFTLEKEIHYFYHRYVNHNQLSELHRLENARNRYLMRFEPDKADAQKVRDNLRWVGAYLDTPVDDIWYRNLFELRGRETYACDFSNLTAHIPADAWPRVQAIVRRLRVLYTMRDPVKRLWSHTKFHLQVTNQLEKLKTWSPGDFEAFVRQPHIWNNAEYGAVLRRLREGLAPETYKVIFYEDIHADQIAMLRDIEKFLGVAEFNYPEPLLNRRFTESAKIEMPAFFPGLFAADIARIRSEIEAEGHTLPAAWG